MTINVRRGNKNDTTSIVELFSEDGNPHNWTIEKWSRYYESYTEGKPIIFVAEVDDKIVGHYSLFPISVSGYQTYLGAHAYISIKLRGLAVLSSLMKSLDEFCIANQIPFIIGFANPRFTIIKNKLFKWKTPFYLSFIKKQEYNPSDYINRPYSLNYSAEWFQWRFGKDTPPFISEYIKQDSGDAVYQLLYANDFTTIQNLGIPNFEVWAPEGYITQQSEDFSQPFSIKIYDKNWEGPDLLDPNNWLLQMADSDTFVFKDYNNE